MLELHKVHNINDIVTYMKANFVKYVVSSRNEKNWVTDKTLTANPLVIESEVYIILYGEKPLKPNLEKFLKVRWNWKTFVGLVRVYQAFRTAMVI